MSEYAITQVFPGDKRTLASVDALLRREGITRDANLDYISAMLDEDGEVIATGSCFGNTLRCFAVSSDHQGEGLLNEIVSHLMEYQLGRGNSHLFLYTKVKAARFFESLGFYEIARVEGTLVFMENRRNGFPNYLKALEKTARPGASAAIVMNANPFTLGHRYLWRPPGSSAIPCICSYSVRTPAWCPSPCGRSWCARGRRTFPMWLSMIPAPISSAMPPSPAIFSRMRRL